MRMTGKGGSGAECLPLDVNELLLQVATHYKKGFRF